MNELLKEALLAMAKKAGNEEDGGKALKYSQSALNLAHAGSMLQGVNKQAELLKQEKKKAGAS